MEEVLQYQRVFSPLWLLVVVAVGACGDDDDTPRDAGPLAMDSGMLDSGSEPPKDEDSGPTCEKVYSMNALGRLLHVSVDEYCAQKWCPDSLSAFTDTLRCTAYEDGGSMSPWDYLDAGAGVGRPWLRSEGCERVAFHLLGMPFRVFEFNPDSGELTGIEEFDDLGSPVLDTSCDHGGILAGAITEECAGDIKSACEGS